MSTLVETPDTTGAYPRLSRQQLASLERAGRRRETPDGEALIREGDVDYDFFVVLEGHVAVIDESSSEPELIAVHEPSRFLGELSLLTGQASPFTAVVREPGAVLQIPAEQLRALATRDSVIGFPMPGWISSRTRAPRRRCSDSGFRRRTPPSSSSVGIACCGTRRMPTWRERWGCATSERRRGSATSSWSAPAPAGLAAAVYGASEGLETVALDAVASGGQAATPSRIENYLGFPGVCPVAKLAERATIQARKFGAHVVVPAEAVGLERRDGRYTIEVSDGTTISARAVVIATGAHYRRLEVARLDEFEPTCVYYAATQMEARMCLDDPIVIVGGGNSAGQATVFLSHFAAGVTLIVREPR